MAEKSQLPDWAAMLLIGLAVGSGGGGLVGTVISGKPSIQIHLPESTQEFQESVVTQTRGIQNDVSDIKLTLARMYTKLDDLEKAGKIGEKERQDLRSRVQQLQEIVGRATKGPEGQP